MWNLDKDPHLTSAFANVSVLDRVPDRDYLRAKLGQAVADVPRLRQRVVPAFGRLAPPTWEEDTAFDLDYHLRWTALPRPGDERALLRLTTRLHQQGFERSRPLWEFVVVEGLSGGRAAMVQRLHHTVTDGVGGLRLAERFLDLERDPGGSDTRPHPPEPTEDGAGPTFVGRVLGTDDATPLEFWVAIAPGAHLNFAQCQELRDALERIMTLGVMLASQADDREGRHH